MTAETRANLLGTNQYWYEISAVRANTTLQCGIFQRCFYSDRRGGPRTAIPEQSDHRRSERGLLRRPKVAIQAFPTGVQTKPRSGRWWERIRDPSEISCSGCNLCTVYNRSIHIRSFTASQIYYSLPAGGKSENWKYETFSQIYKGHLTELKKVEEDNPECYHLILNLLFSKCM